MDVGSTSSKHPVTQDNETVLSLFKDLVVSQDMAVPVAAMNALVLKLKVSTYSSYLSRDPISS